MKKIIVKIALFAVVCLLVVACAANKPKKKQQPKRGPIPCPVKDC